MANEPGDPHVIKKQRFGGTRHGEVTYYAVGWRRSAKSNAEDDLARFLAEDAREVDQVIARAINANGQEAIDKLRGQLAALRSALEAAIDEIQAMSDSPNRGYSMRVMNELNAALATDAGRLEAEVLRAAGVVIDSAERSEAGLITMNARSWQNLEALASKVDAMNAAKETP